MRVAFAIEYKLFSSIIHLMLLLELAELLAVNIIHYSRSVSE